jgi:hypothetical protein
MRESWRSALLIEERDGAVAEWGVPGGTPAQLLRRGIDKDVLRVGAVVSVDGF